MRGYAWMFGTIFDSTIQWPRCTHICEKLLLALPLTCFEPKLCCVALGVWQLIYHIGSLSIFQQIPGRHQVPAPTWVRNWRFVTKVGWCNFWSCSPSTRRRPVCAAGGEKGRGYYAARPCDKPHFDAPRLSRKFKWREDICSRTIPAGELLLREERMCPSWWWR